MPSSIKLFDSYQKKEIILEPANSVEINTLKIYSCGPTVYNYMHIGNLRAAWLGDAISNVAKMAGWKAEWISNITDVGHLVDDGDDGEDKLEKGAKREGKKVQDIVDFYTQDYLKQCQAIGIKLPTGIMQPKATEYIPEQMLLALTLLKDKKAYTLDDGIYFDSEFNNQLFEQSEILKNHQPLKAILEIQAKQKAGQSNDYNDRNIKNTTKNSGDFALWKFVTEDSLQKWRFQDFAVVKDLVENVEIMAKWGCPGWHSECVAMICDVTRQLQDLKNLESSPKTQFSFQEFTNRTVIDLHLGGEDHIDVHHKNEILQSEALGFHLSNFWVHNKFVLVDGKKMSKSLGNVFLVVGKYEDTGFYSLENPPQEVQDKFKIERFDPLAYRLLMMEHSYNTQLDFTWEKLAQSQTRLFNLRKLGARALSFANYQGVKKIQSKASPMIDQLTKILIEDLDFPSFLSQYSQFLESLINKITKEQILTDIDFELIELFDKEVLKLKIIENPSQGAVELAKNRQIAKADKDWSEADSIRQQISQLGYQIDDYPWGYGLWLNPTLPKNSIQETL